MLSGQALDPAWLTYYMCNPEQIFKNPVPHFPLPYNGNNNSHNLSWRSRELNHIKQLIFDHCLPSRWIKIQSFSNTVGRLLENREFHPLLMEGNLEIPLLRTYPIDILAQVWKDRYTRFFISYWKPTVHQKWWLHKEWQIHDMEQYAAVLVS